MRPLRHRVLVALIGYANAYTVLAVYLLSDETATMQTGIVFGLGMIWIGHRAATAITDVFAILAARLARRRELLRRARLLDAYQPGAVRPTSLADYMTAANRAA